MRLLTVIVLASGAAVDNFARRETLQGQPQFSFTGLEVVEFKFGGAADPKKEWASENECPEDSPCQEDDNREQWLEIYCEKVGKKCKKAGGKVKGESEGHEVLCQICDGDENDDEERCEEVFGVLCEDVDDSASNASDDEDEIEAEEEEEEREEDDLEEDDAPANKGKNGKSKGKKNKGKNGKNRSDEGEGEEGSKSTPTGETTGCPMCCGGCSCGDGGPLAPSKERQKDEGCNAPDALRLGLFFLVFFVFGE